MGGDDYPIVVIGASAGGFDALKELVSKLPSDFNGAIFIVWHMSPTIEGVLPNVLNRLNSLFHASNAIDKEPILPKRIYVAPPDKHLLIEKGRVRVTRGPKENRFRPAVDPLFRSAAFNYGETVIGIILSGALDDGTAGLWSVKYYGGTAIVQDPEEAKVIGMPENALREVDVDYCVPVTKIADILAKWQPRQKVNDDVVKNDKKTEAEIRIASQDNAFALGIMELGELTPFTCPECHGVLASLKDGNIKRYRCHTGHAFSADSLLSSITERIEESIFGAIRGMDESVMLLNHVGDHFAEKNETKLASYYFNKAKEAQDRSAILRLAVFGNEQLNEQRIREEAER
jgi:two-component system, chemotaxis family, protein-glutamate methylesterase/glutaminase